MKQKKVIDRASAGLSAAPGWIVMMALIMVPRRAMSPCHPRCILRPGTTRAAGMPMMCDAFVMKAVLIFRVCVCWGVRPGIGMITTMFRY